METDCLTFEIFHTTSKLVRKEWWIGNEWDYRMWFPKRGLISMMEYGLRGGTFGMQLHRPRRWIIYLWLYSFDVCRLSQAKGFFFFKQSKIIGTWISANVNRGKCSVVQEHWRCPGALSQRWGQNCLRMPQGGSFDLLLKMCIGFPLNAVHGSHMRLYFPKKFLFS